MLAISTYADVLVGYGIAAALLGVVAWRIVARGRALGRLVADEDKPWI
jgi:hypothetical protein